MINNLTTKQIAAMQNYVEYYTTTLPVKQATDEELHEAVKKLYRLCNLDIPNLILIANNPVEAQYMANMIDSNQVRYQVRDQMSNQVWNQVRNQVRDQVRNQVRNQVSKQVSKQVRDQMSNQVWEQVSNQVSKQVSKQGVNFYEFSYYGNFSDYDWSAFYQYFNEICNLKYNKNWEIWLSIIQTGFYNMIQLDKIAIIVRNPIKLDFDKNGKLKNGLSIKFKGLEYLVLDKKLINYEGIITWWKNSANPTIEKLRALVRVE